MPEKFYFSLGVVGYEIWSEDTSGDFLCWRYVDGTSGAVETGKPHIAKVQYTNAGRAYINVRSRRVYLDQCIRTRM